MKTGSDRVISWAAVFSLPGRPTSGRRAAERGQRSASLQCRSSGLNSFYLFFVSIRSSTVLAFYLKQVARLMVSSAWAAPHFLGTINSKTIQMSSLILSTFAERLTELGSKNYLPGATSLLRSFVPNSNSGKVVQVGKYLPPEVTLPPTTQAISYWDSPQVLESMGSLQLVHKLKLSVKEAYASNSVHSLGTHSWVLQVGSCPGFTRERKVIAGKVKKILPSCFLRPIVRRNSLIDREIFSGKKNIYLRSCGTSVVPFIAAFLGLLAICLLEQLEGPPTHSLPHPGERFVAIEIPC
ncbi:hypothetical protein ISN44_Un159g000340 (mitochondrion) [Arabidopsis suecica]|uniref:Uncharacterized protein n=1 Tax=Arabidopsis suecica TaxID=45249 RepID=A0A8T1X9C8_ARASU|nr:hypothetical protein ISN44_Un159g000340 [Arabidopsis suecica]